MASATPDLRLPSQPQGITIGWYQIILLGDRGCPGLHSSGEAEIQTHDLLIATYKISFKIYHCLHFYRTTQTVKYKLAS